MHQCCIIERTIFTVCNLGVKLVIVVIKSFLLILKIISFRVISHLSNLIQ